MIDVKITVDTRDFDKAYNQYVALSKKMPADICNKTAYEVAKLSVARTKTTPKEQIAAELSVSGKGGAPLAALIVNAKRGKQGKKGLNGIAMAKAVATLIKRRMRTSKFIAAGWLAAVKAIAPHVSGKKGVTPSGKTKAKLGGAKAAKQQSDNKAETSIWNNVFGGKGKNSKPDRVTQIEKEGLQRAIQEKTADMYVYINRKLAEAARAFNR
jgi:hypothetical protein